MPKDRQNEPVRETTPQRFADTTPIQQFPSSDYSFTLQAVMEMQKAVGALTEAVKVLQRQSDRHDAKLGEIGKDVHTVKVTARIIGAVLAGALAFGGWSIGKAVDVFVKIYQPYVTQPRTEIPPAQPPR